jgi:hypothetical protein
MVPKLGSGSLIGGSWLVGTMAEASFGLST